jgi:hypothetical protein
MRSGLRSTLFTALLACSRDARVEPNLARPPATPSSATTASAAAAVVTAAPSAPVALEGPSGLAATARALEGGSWQRMLTVSQQKVAHTVFASDGLLWVCRVAICSAWPWPTRMPLQIDPAPTVSVTLPCDQRSLTYSADGAYLGVSCNDQEGEAFLWLLRTHDQANRRYPLSLRREAGRYDNEEVVDLAVDGRGELTAVTSDHRIIRLAGSGGMRAWKVDPPKRLVNAQETADLRAAVGPWLATSDGAYTHEVAWTEETPDQPLPLGGGAFFNGTRMWVSQMSKGYHRWEGRALVKTASRFGGGLPGFGLLQEIGPWQTDKLWVSYERAVLFLDEELREVHRVDLPASTNPDVAPTFRMNASGTRWFAHHLTGELDVWMPR